MGKKAFTLKQRLFVANYLIYKNASKAARIAGYSIKTARSAGARLLTNVDIFEAIKEGLREQLNAVDITAEHIQLALRDMAFAENYSLGYPGKLKALEIYGKSLGLFKK
jgi:phage terminase small subunit